MMKFMIGLLCGVGIGLLAAPAEGKETREQLLRAVRDPNSVAREKMDEVRDKVGDIGAKVGRQAAEQAVDKVTPEGLKTPSPRAG